MQVLLWQRARAPFKGAWSLPAARSHQAKHSRSQSDATSPPRSISVNCPTWSSSRPSAPPAETPPTGARHRLPRPDPNRRRPDPPHRHALAPGRDPPPTRLRPQTDHPRRTRAPPRQALLHQPRLRPRPRRVHNLRTTRHLHRRTRTRGLPNQPATHPSPQTCAAANGKATSPKPERRTPSSPLQLRPTHTRGNRPIRGTPPARKLSPYGALVVTLKIGRHADLYTAPRTRTGSSP